MLYLLFQVHLVLYHDLLRLLPMAGNEVLQFFECKVNLHFPVANHSVKVVREYHPCCHLGISRSLTSIV